MYRYILLIVSLLMLNGCQHTEENIIRFGLSTTPVNLDPRYATDAESARINRLLYQGLVDFDAQLRPIPALAHWVTLSQTHYRFSLSAEHSVFHDGSTLDSHDIKATYDSILDPDTASPHRGSLKQIQQINIIDDNTLDFHIQKPNLLFPALLNLGILPQEKLAKQHPFNRHPIGSGKFRLIHWHATASLRLQRLRDGQLFEFIAVKDPVVRVLKLLRGELDMLQSNLSAELTTWLSQRNDVKINKTQGSNFVYLGFNLADEKTGQHTLRQAIAYALDRQAIIHHVLGDAATPASALLPPTHWAGNPSLLQYDYQPDKARALLAELGISPQHPIQLVFKTSNNPISIRHATVIQHQLKQVGIQVQLRSYDWGTFYSDIKAGRFQLFSLSWVGIKTPDIFRYVFHSQAIPPHGANRGRFIDTMTDTLIEDAEQAKNLTEQAQHYRALQTRLFERLPYVPLWYKDQVLVARLNIEGYTLSADGKYDGLELVSKQTDAGFE